MFMKKVKHLKNTKKRNCQFSIESLFIINTDIQKKKNCYYHDKNSTTEIVLIRKDKSEEKKWYQYFSLVF